LAQADISQNPALGSESILKIGPEN
jgi:hypothetical protein